MIPSWILVIPFCSCLESFILDQQTSWLGSEMNGNIGKIAFQGVRGAYSEDACDAYFGKGVIDGLGNRHGVETIPYQSFAEVFEAAERDMVSHAVVPVENSYEGSVTQVNDLLLEKDLLISGEIILRIRHCLLAMQGTRIEGIKRVYSHPQALGQCRLFLQQFPQWQLISTYDTAGSAAMVKENARNDEAAIASLRAAEVYGLEVLKEGIESDSQNYTRFFILEKHPKHSPGANKTSMVFAAKNTPGSLYMCLKEFAERGINLTKLESRPRRNKPWMYVFHVDIDGNLGDPNISAAIGSLLKTAAFVKVLGTYKKAEEPQDPNAAKA
jgi:prephenate dehydratase